MRTPGSVFACVIAILARPVFGDAQRLTTPPVYTQIKSSVRANLLDVVQNPGADWTVISMSPDKQSGVPVLSDLRVQPVTMTNKTFGSYVVVAHLSQAQSHGQESGTYAWLTYLAVGGQDDIARMESDFPFFAYPDGKPRTILCQLNNNRDGRDKFKNVTVLPEDWISFLQPAIAYISVHPALQAAVLTPSEDNELTVLLKDKNPYLVVTAAQRLASLDLFTAEDLDVVLQTQDTSLIGAVVGTATIAHFQSPDTSELCLNSHTASTASIAQLEGIVLGLSAARDLLKDVSLHNGPNAAVGNLHLDKRELDLQSYTHPIFQASIDRVMQFNAAQTNSAPLEIIKNFATIYILGNP